MTTDPHSPLPAAPLPRVWLRYERWRATAHDTFDRKHGHRLPTWHNRRTARRLVLVQVANLGLILIAACLSYTTNLFMVPFVIGLIGGISVQFLLRIVTGSVADYPALALDELQLAQRNAARSMGFGILLALMFIPYVILITLSVRYYDDAVPASYVYGCGVTLIALMVVGSMIPTLFTSWWTPDVDDEDSI